MITKLVYSVLYFVGAAICFSIWKKQRDRDWLVFGWLAVIGCVLEIINYFVHVVQVSANLVVFSNDAILVFAPIEIVVLAWIGVKLVSTKNSSKK
jgi:hypothetical protein